MYMYDRPRGHFVARLTPDLPVMKLIINFLTDSAGTVCGPLPDNISIDGTLLAVRLYSSTVAGPLTAYYLYDQWGTNVILPALAASLGTDYRITIRNAEAPNITKPVVTAGPHFFYAAELAGSNHHGTFELTYIEDYSPRVLGRL